MAVSVCIYGFLVCLVIVQVFNRYVLGHALMWGDELAKLLLVWGIMLAVPLCIYHKRHMGVDNLLAKLSPRNQKILWTFINLLIIGMGIFYIIEGFKLTGKNYVQIMATLHISKAVSYAAVPVCAIFWTLFAIADIFMVWAETPRTPLIAQEDLAAPEHKEGGDGTC